MGKSEIYAEKFSRIAAQTLFGRLQAEQREFLRRQAFDYRFSQQELRQLSEIAIDLAMWGGRSIMEAWPPTPAAELPPKEFKRRVIEALSRHRDELRSRPRQYGVAADSIGSGQYRIRSGARSRERLGLGYCPVASERTRCCNLLTLDAVENCGFACSYCSIQSFYHDDEIHFDSGFADKLNALAIDSDRTYHIGTGQSSDSLMWGNRFGVLDALMAFARRHPNVILELKSKSKNIAYLLKNPIPPNVLCTWSLNPPAVIRHEEQLTASLEARLRAARRVADRGILVGFHFHPMIHYAEWQADYAALFARLLEGFEPYEVAMVSLGTLTFTKAVIRQIRAGGFRSRILQMPLVESDGKLSYPDEIKLEMFSHAYRSLAPWHGQVFFYLCMENQRLWRPVFGFDYPSNQAFEEAMKAGYLEKIQRGGSK
jgi:spore photoproduct lyase